MRPAKRIWHGPPSTRSCDKPALSKHQRVEGVCSELLGGLETGKHRRVEGACPELASGASKELADVVLNTFDDSLLKSSAIEVTWFTGED